MTWYRKYKKRSSRVVKMKFQSFVDISTQADNMQIISVNAGGDNVIRRLSPFFSAYKYYKLGGVSIKMIPASTLPVDPTGLSYEAGDNATVDPRDQLTPGMCRITNGEDILEDITGLSGDQQRQLYDNMLLDPRWFKWMLQSGVKRFGKPRYWQIGQLHQDKWPGAVTNLPEFSQAGAFEGTGHMVERISDPGSQMQFIQAGGSSPYGIFQTGKRGVLGWMPTDSFQPIFEPDEVDPIKLRSLLASVPEVELFKILMPPMHKTNYYYRMFITETVYFKDPVVMNVNGYRPIDVFHRSVIGTPRNPDSEALPTSESEMDRYTGGNHGDNKSF